jgi:hypothetical protein
MTISELKLAISECGKNVAVVTFTKKNGAERVMKCTRNFDLLDEDSAALNYTRPTQEPNYDCEALDMVRVWDLENEGWRTITAKTTTSVVDSGEPIIQ